MHNFKYHKKKYILATFSILLVVFFILYRQGFFENKALKSAAYWERQARMRESDSLVKTNSGKKVVGGLSADSIVRFDPEDPDGKDFKGTYFIIAGSFANPENATIVAGKYRDLGYGTSIIRTIDRYGNKIQLVSVRTFNDYDEAVRYLREFQKNIDPAAWLYPR
jgi:hypothetical protein